MSKVIAVVEGSTEQTFVREVLGPWLWDAGRVEFVASPAGKPGKKGGNDVASVAGRLMMQRPPIRILPFYLACRNIFSTNAR